MKSSVWFEAVPRPAIAAAATLMVGALLGPLASEAGAAGTSWTYIYSTAESVDLFVEDDPNLTAENQLLQADSFAEAIDFNPAGTATANVVTARAGGFVYGPAASYAAIESDGSRAGGAQPGFLDAWGSSAIGSTYLVQPGSGPGAPAVGSTVSVDVTWRVSGTVRFRDPGGAFTEDSDALAWADGYAYLEAWGTEYTFLIGQGGVANGAPWESDEFAGAWTTSTGPDGTITGVLDFEKTYTLEVLAGESFDMRWDMVTSASADLPEAVFLESDFLEGGRVTVVSSAGGDFTVIEVDAIPEPGLLALIAGPALLLRRRRL